MVIHKKHAHLSFIGPYVNMTYVKLVSSHDKHHCSDTSTDRCITLSISRVILAGIYISDEWFELTHGSVGWKSMPFTRSERAKSCL